MNLKKYVIAEVLDRKTKKRSEEFGYRVGRECYIKNLEVGTLMWVKYEDGRMFRTSIVEDFIECEYGIWVTTGNREYRFDDVLMLDGN